MQTLEGRNIVVWDAEIKNTIDGKEITWKDFGKMHTSVACLYDYRDGDFKVYMDDNLSELSKRLLEADLCVAFNCLGFDIPLLINDPMNKVQFTMEQLKVYDLLFYSRKSVGWTESARFPTGLKLDDHLEGTFGTENMKTAHGSEAPLMWQQGRIGELVSYCLADVKREKKLFEHVWAGQPVITKTHGERFLESPRVALGL